MESSPEGLLSRVRMVGREDEIQPYTGLVFLRIPALSDDAPGLLSLHVTAAGTWEPLSSDHRQGLLWLLCIH